MRRRNRPFVAEVADQVGSERLEPPKEAEPRSLAQTPETGHRAIEEVFLRQSALPSCAESRIAGSSQSQSRSISCGDGSLPASVFSFVLPCVVLFQFS